MICQVCGSENETGKFCSKCGSPLQNPETASTQPVNPNQNQQNQSSSGQQPYQNYNSQQPYYVNQNQQQNYGNLNQQQYGGGYHQPYPNPQQQNVYMEKGKVVSKQYFSFFLDSFKHPVTFGNTVNGENWLNGLITLILSVIILSLSFANYVKSMFSFSGFGLFDAGGLFGISFWGTFFSGILFLSIFAVITLLIVFGVVKLLNNVNVSFKDVLARSGSFATVPTFIFLLFLLVTFINAYNVIFFVSTLINGAFILAVSLTIASFRTNGKLDMFYSILIALAVSALIQIIGFNTFLQNMIGQILDGFFF